LPQKYTFRPLKIRFISGLTKIRVKKELAFVPVIKKISQRNKKGQTFGAIAHNHKIKLTQKTFF
jgi:hypothetical protein